MSRDDRLPRIKRLLDTGRCVSRETLLRQLEVSPATLKRDIQWLRDRHDAPIAWEREGAGWRLVRRAGLDAQMELTGLYFTAEEIHALLTMQHLLANLDAGGLLASHIAPLRQRLHRLLGSGTPPNAEVARRIRLMTVGARRLHLPHFQSVGSALLRRRRLVIAYRNRTRDDRTEREVSPQRLVHYRDNWYLDAWCHWRQALRSFSVDAVDEVRVLDRPAIDVSDAELDDMLGAGYGIFAGRDVKLAGLRFSVERSRYVSAEKWHPKQHGRFDSQGRWVLDVPYADARELVMDILRHVPEVEVLWPEELEQAVRSKLEAGLRRMRGLDE